MRREIFLVVFIGVQVLLETDWYHPLVIGFCAFALLLTTVYIDNFSIRQDLDAAITSAMDYYPGGMPILGRNTIGDYRYAFKGQEKDPETGKEAFELRLWDGRIGRWLTTDPYNEFPSPYLGMGNNWVSQVDPDGGKADDWYKDADGNYVYDSNLTAANASSFLGAGETYVGESFWDFNALQKGNIDGVLTQFN